MRVAFGLKAHSGWAVLVVLGAAGNDLSLVDRRRLELVEAGDAAWAKQPYHAAEKLASREAEKLVDRGVQSARRLALREMKAALRRAARAEHQVAACAVLASDPMPDWSVGEILAVHFRMHKAEGVLFRDALARAAEAGGVRLVAIPEKRLAEHARGALGKAAGGLTRRISALGKTAGAPWGRDQKEAALAALVALKR